MGDVFFQTHHGFLVDGVDGEDSDVEVDDGSLTLVLRRPVLVVFLELSGQDVVKHQSCLRADPVNASSIFVSNGVHSKLFLGQ